MGGQVYRSSSKKKKKIEHRNVLDALRNRIDFFETVIASFVDPQEDYQIKYTKQYCYWIKLDKGQRTKDKFLLSD